MTPLSRSFPIVLALLPVAASSQGEVTFLGYDRLDDGGAGPGNKVELPDRGRFGDSATCLGDVDGDGSLELVVGAPALVDDTGEVWVLSMNPPTGRCRGVHSFTASSFPAGTLEIDDRFGCALAPLGDLDGNGVVDLAIGARKDDDGGTNRGAVYILYLESDLSILATEKISSTSGGFGGDLDNGDSFGSSLANLGDLDGDGWPELAVGAALDNDGGQDRGALWILFLDPGGPGGLVKAEQKISATSGNLGAVLADNQRLGSSVTGMQDFDGDGIFDLAVGAPGESGEAGLGFGRCWMLMLDTDGTVKSEREYTPGLSGLPPGFGQPPTSGNSSFGTDLVRIDDVDGNGVDDLVVSSPDDLSGTVWLLFLNPDGTVLGTEITYAPFDDDQCTPPGIGSGLASLGDVDGNGVPDLWIGAHKLESAGLPGTCQGGGWTVYLDATGVALGELHIDASQGYGLYGLGGGFGFGSGRIGDVDGDGIEDMAVYQGGGTSGSANSQTGVWIVFLDALRGIKGLTRLENGTNGVTPSRKLRVHEFLTAGDVDGDLVPDVYATRPVDGEEMFLADRPGFISLWNLNADGTVKTDTKIGGNSGGFVGPLAPGAGFGSALTDLGDVDGDGLSDLATSAPGLDVIYLLFRDANGLVRDQMEISEAMGSFSGGLEPNEVLGSDLASLGDLDGNGVPDLALRSTFESFQRLWFLRLDSSGAVIGATSLRSDHPDVQALLPPGAFNPLEFGDMATLGDVNRDGNRDLIATTNEGLLIVRLTDDGSVKGLSLHHFDDPSWNWSSSSDISMWSELDSSGFSILTADPAFLAWTTGAVFFANYAYDQPDRTDGTPLPFPAMGTSVGGKRR